METTDYDLDMGTWEYIGVAVEVQRPMLTDRAQAAVVMAKSHQMPITDDEYWKYVYLNLPEAERKALFEALGGNADSIDPNKLTELYETWLIKQDERLDAIDAEVQTSLSTLDELPEGTHAISGGGVPENTYDGTEPDFDDFEYQQDTVRSAYEPE